MPERCICCGARTFAQDTVLWPELIEAWELDAGEAAAIDLQQGWHCTVCGNNLRAMALARAIVRICGGREPLASFVQSHRAHGIRILEINEAGNLTPVLARMPHHRIVHFPAVSMTALPFAPGSFDIVCHSDTLEHVEQPVAALRECRRVLAPGGSVALTVPIVPGRLTRRRAGLPPSYHGDPSTATAEMLVHTEYGADAWLDVIAAGFAECRIIAVAAAHALIGSAGDRWAGEA
ncbi:MAG TPA: methyltransferase domain-containing protein [Candidatus Elarobacter sp.]|nr:methyltransferase domain-containing protein [Candidatus Elarobacter sp.]